MRETKKALANKAKRVLDIMLQADANSASCMMIYQPKAPEALSRFKKKK